jgi:hypothetical protein
MVQYLARQAQSAELAIEASHVTPHIRRINEVFDRSKLMISGDVLLKLKLKEQARRVGAKGISTIRIAVTVQAVNIRRKPHSDESHSIKAVRRLYC